LSHIPRLQGMEDSKTTQEVLAHWAEVESVFKDKENLDKKPPRMPQETFDELLRWRELFKMGPTRVSYPDEEEDAASGDGAATAVASSGPPVTSSWLESLKTDLTSTGAGAAAAPSSDAAAAAACALALESLDLVPRMEPVKPKPSVLRVQRPISSKYFRHAHSSTKK